MKALLAVAVSLCALALSALAQEPTIVRYVDEDLTRKPVHTVVPTYPRKARRDRIEGDVKVCFEIDRKGRPFRIAVRDSTHRLFESAAKKAIRASSYKPLAPDEKPVGLKTCRTFRFRLEPVAIE